MFQGELYMLLLDASNYKELQDKRLLETRPSGNSRIKRMGWPLWGQRKSREANTVATSSNLVSRGNN